MGSIIMPRESKILNIGNLDAESIVHHYESFGWELLCLNGPQIALSRETKNPIYSRLVAYQTQYEEKLSEFNSMLMPKIPREPEPFSWKSFLLRTLLFIVPGVLYVLGKKKEKAEYETAKAEYDAAVIEYNVRKDAFLAEMAKLTAESRALFFGSQE